ncbi:MAG TPA: DNA gyrase C-terminal beta-propeller domain-containing protein, partial [Pirellulales bacterium]|nr:DNA gyrase C-terminal beta-propeller domain-containing protein [Pirellulales bacterium]
RQMSIKRLIEEYIRHRTEVIRRRTQFLMAKARSRKHTVEGLLLALANIDEVVQVIRNSGTQAQAKERLMQIECPAALLERALGQRGFTAFQEERGEAGSYTLTPVQADAILKMTLGQLVNLEQERLGDEHQKLLNNIAEYLEILSDHSNLLKIVRDDLAELKRKHGEPRRTQLSGEEIGDVDLEDLITEETMVVSISHSGRIKRTPASVYRSQRRGGKGLKGAKTEDEDPIEHLFVASTHAYLLFFTNKGRVYWQKVYGLPQLGRDSRGRAVVNLLNLNPEEKIADCRAVRDFDKPGHFLMMATARGLVKKTPLEAYSRPRQGGIIAINLREGDELVDVVVTKPGDEVVLASAGGMSIRFKESDVRSMGRNSMGVKGISLSAGDPLVGMVVVDPQATLLTACANGYGKRTLFGLGESSSANQAEGEDEEADETSSTSRYRIQRRGGKGVRDIKTTKRNGPVIGITRVTDGDEVMIMTRRGKIQRIAASDVSVIGRNTQGVRIMSIGADDSLVAVVRVPKEENGEEHQETASPSISEEQADRSESENVRTEMDPDADNK